jgi:N-acetylmuramoyl-L-alanine amidase
MKYSFWIKITLFFLISSAIVAALAILLGGFDLNALKNTASIPTNGSPTRKYTTVIIDAGHGGEDGGASSASGLIEKDVNLEIAHILAEMLRANGVDVIMTREDDRLLYDRNTDYQGRKKKLDLAARLAIADSAEDAILISIHMNSFTDPRYAGLQVWYSPNNADSEPLAELIRVENKEKLQPQNNRKTKMATSAINLLYNAKCPAVLVECGFLSNPDEAALFESKEYRQNVAFTIFCAVTEFLSNSEQMP